MRSNTRQRRELDRQAHPDLAIRTQRWKLVLMLAGWLSGLTVCHRSGSCRLYSGELTVAVPPLLARVAVAFQSAPHGDPHRAMTWMLKLAVPPPASVSAVMDKVLVVVLTPVTVTPVPEMLPGTYWMQGGRSSWMVMPVSGELVWLV